MTQKTNLPKSLGGDPQINPVDLPVDLQRRGIQAHAPFKQAEAVASLAHEILLAMLQGGNTLTPGALAEQAFRKAEAFAAEGLLRHESVTRIHGPARAGVMEEINQYLRSREGGNATTE